MPVPKKRHSIARGRKRRTHWKLSLPTLSRCSHCSAPKPPHQVCPNCGYYRGREVLMVKKRGEAK